MIIRYLKKCKDLGIKPVKENIDMVYFFLKHSNNVYYDYKNFREKTYKKFKLIKKVKYYQEDTNELELITRRGYDRVNLEGYDYYSLLKNIIVKINKEN